MDACRPPPPGEDSAAERKRLRRVYLAHLSDPRYRELWSGEATRFERDRKWRAITRLLQKKGVKIETARVLELGAGEGIDSDRFRKLGVPPERMVAIDILETAVREARSAHPWLPVVQADAFRLPFADGSFDLVYQSTMISSILDRDRRRRVLDEIRRVLDPEGVFLSYDLRYPNPWNPNTRPLRASELRAAFSLYTLEVRSCTLIPPIARALSALPPSFRWALEHLAPMRSHFLILVRPVGAQKASR